MKIKNNLEILEKFTCYNHFFGRINGKRKLLTEVNPDEVDRLKQYENISIIMGHSLYAPELKKVLVYIN